MGDVRRVLLIPLVAAAACYEPTPPEGAPCSKDLSCPAALMCVFGKCVAETPPCIPIEAGPGALSVPRLDTTLSPLRLDGNLDDWPTCFVTVDKTSAGLVRDLNGGGGYAPGRFSVVADATHLFVAAELQFTAPLGDQPPPRVYENDAISVYFDGNGTFLTRQYDPDAAQIVVDHANREQAFRGGTIVTLPAVASAAKVAGTSFVIEMSVTPATFGLTAFGATIGFDIGLVGGDGTIMTSELVWYQACAAPACGCTNGDAAPYCDARELGTVTITP